MKRIKKQSSFFFLLGTLLISSAVLVSCRMEPTITPEEKALAQKEITVICNKLFKDAEQLNAESMMQPYLRTSDFMEIAPNGASSNFEAMKKRNTDGFNRIASFQSKTIREEFRFLTKNQVLYTWFGKIEMILKTGEKYKSDIQVSSLLFSKINNEWKIIYDQTSGMPPIKVDSKK